MPSMNWLSVHSVTARSQVDTKGELLLDNVARFRDPSEHEARRPFPAYEHEPKAMGPVPDEWETIPFFSRIRSGTRSIAVVEIPITSGTSLYGTGEQAGPLLRNGTKKVTWNHDAFSYDEQYAHLYQSHPWVLAVRPDGTAFGVLVESTRRVTIDLRRSIRFEVDGASPAAVIIEGESPKEVLVALARLTGTMALPPRWALGYHQCRYSYYPEARVRAIGNGFRDRTIPCDVIWLDIDYMDGFRCFTWDAKHFPNPKGMIDDLHSRGFRVITMIDPGIKVDPNYKVYADGLKGDHYVKAGVGPAASSRATHATTDTPQNIIGKVWPGDCAFPDFTSARTREWWAGLYADFMKSGIDGVWNDMNEPAIFDGFSKSMAGDALHNADADLGGPGTHEDYHNIYGMQMVRASLEGIQRTNPDKRPFVLTRANFLGGHRYAATWTGDNRSDWKHLSWSVPMVLNLGLSGQGFSGPDIGGFTGNANGPLLARWMGIGALLPFSRAHAETGGIDHEPWSFDANCEATCRRAIERRMRLLPYLYTLFRESSVNGLPPMRPLFFADPADPRLRAVDTMFMLGDDLLVRCDTAPGHDRGTRNSIMPKGDWLPFEPLMTSDPELPDLFLRAGAILPMGPIMQWSDEHAVDPLTLVVALGADGKASGTLYEDAGEGYAYKQGDYRLATYTASVVKGVCTVHAATQQGSMKAPLSRSSPTDSQRRINVVVLSKGSDGLVRTHLGHGYEGAPIMVLLV